MHDNVLAAHDHPAATKNLDQAELLPRPSTASAPDVWNQVGELMATADIDPRPEIDPEQGNAPVYVQTARLSDAYRAEQVFTEHDIDTIFLQRENPAVHGGRESRHSTTRTTAR